MQRRFSSFVIAATVTLCVLLATVANGIPAHADGQCNADQVQISVDLGSGTTSKKLPNGTTVYCVSKGDGNLNTNPIYIWIVAILAFMNPIVGIAVTGGIVWGAIVYTTAGGNAAKTKQAIVIITNSIISLIFYILLFAIVNFVVPGGVLK